MIKQYLGDGLYVESDGVIFRLYANNLDGEHEVFLDGPTIDTFLLFVKKVEAMNMDGLAGAPPKSVK